MVEAYSQKEEAILEAAMQIFLEKGWHGTRMQEIADRAGVNKAMVHYYFRNKERLYYTIFRRLFLRFMQTIEQAFIAGADFATTLRTFIDKITDMLAAEPRLPLFIARELSEGGTVVARAIADLQKESLLKAPDKMLAAMEQAKAGGEIEFSYAPIQFLLSVIGSCVYFFIAEPIVQVLVPGAITNRQGFLQERKEALFHIFYEAIRKRPGTDVI